jgi:DNA-binding transcriptional MerR regulator
VGDYLIGEVAALAHVSVRTLHHYDGIGLLKPSGRTAVGYRSYSAADLERLREIVYYRALDFGLDEIAAILDGTGGSRDDHLRRQYHRVRERHRRDTALLAAIEHELEARDMGIKLTPEEQFEVFGTDAFGGEYADEAEQRWGDTDAWRESQRRASAYTKDDWLAIKAEGEAVEAGFAAAFRAGEPADGLRATQLAQAHRDHISRWFYDCSAEMHVGLAQMYIGDERFADHFDQRVPGLAVYVRDAILANAARPSGG